MWSGGRFPVDNADAADPSGTDPYGELRHSRLTTEPHVPLGWFVAPTLPAPGMEGVGREHVCSGRNQYNNRLLEGIAHSAIWQAPFPATGTSVAQMAREAACTETMAALAVRCGPVSRLRAQQWPSRLHR